MKYGDGYNELKETGRRTLSKLSLNSFVSKMHGTNITCHFMGKMTFRKSGIRFHH